LEKLVREKLREALTSLSTEHGKVMVQNEFAEVFRSDELGPMAEIMEEESPGK